MRISDTLHRIGGAARGVKAALDSLQIGAPWGVVIDWPSGKEIKVADHIRGRVRSIVTDIHQGIESGFIDSRYAGFLLSCPQTLDIEIKGRGVRRVSIPSEDRGKEEVIGRIASELAADHYGKTC